VFVLSLSEVTRVPNVEQVLSHSFRLWVDRVPRKNMERPLLEPVSSKRASKLQTLGNIIVTVVGTGVLGLPFAFRIAGWVAGSLGVAVVGLSTYYCMLLLVGDSIF